MVNDVVGRCTRHGTEVDRDLRRLRQYVRRGTALHHCHARRRTDKACRGRDLLHDFLDDRHQNRQIAKDRAHGISCILGDLVEHFRQIWFNVGRELVVFDILDDVCHLACTRMLRRLRGVTALEIE